MPVLPHQATFFEDLVEGYGSLSAPAELRKRAPAGIGQEPVLYRFEQLEVLDRNESRDESLAAKQNHALVSSESTQIRCRKACLGRISSIVVKRERGQVVYEVEGHFSNIARH